jgi:hypothetical protein
MRARRPQPLGLLLAYERLVGSEARPRPRRDSPTERHQLVRAVVGRSGPRIQPELFERALLELLDPHPLLGAGQLVAVHRVDQFVVLTW